MTKLLDLGPFLSLPEKIDAINARLASLEQLVLQRQAADPDQLLDVEAAAELRGCTVAAFRKLVQRGRVPVVRAGRTVRVRRRDVLGGGDR